MKILLAILLVALPLLAAAGLVRLIELSFSRTRLATRISDAEAILVGLPIAGGLLHLSGLFSVTIPGMLAILVPLAIVGLVRLRIPRDVPRVHGSLEIAGAAVIAGALIVGFLLAIAPPFMRDEVAYHLAVPAVWAVEGRVVELPLMSHSYFPFGFESIYPLHLLVLGKVWGGIAVHLLHLIVAGVAVMLCLRLSGSWALTAAIASTPVLLATAGAAMLEWPLIGVTLVMIASLKRAEPDRLLLALAVAAGLMLKYTFPLIAAVVLAGLVRRPMMRSLVAPILIGLALGSLFYVRNAVWTGNPVEPLLAGETEEITRYRTSEGSVPLPWGYVFDPVQFDESTGLAIWMIIVAGGIVALRRGRDARLLLFAAGSIAILAIVGPAARILMPFAVIAALEAWRRGFAPPSRVMHGLALVTLILAVSQLVVTAGITLSLRPWEVITGGRSAEEWIAGRREAHRAVLWLNQTLTENDRAFIVGIPELFWVDGSPRGGGNADFDRVSRYLAAPGFEERLVSDGITHVAVEGEARTSGEYPAPSDPVPGEIISQLPDGSTLWRLSAPGARRHR